MVWCLESLDENRNLYYMYLILSLNFNNDTRFYSKISRTNLPRKLNNKTQNLREFFSRRSTNWEKKNQKRESFSSLLLSVFKKSCATIVTGDVNFLRPDLSAERMNHRRRRDGLEEGWGKEGRDETPLAICQELLSCFYRVAVARSHIKQINLVRGSVYLRAPAPFRSFHYHGKPTGRIRLFDGGSTDFAPLLS